MNLGESFSSDTCERFQRLVDLLISSPHNLTSVRDRERAMVAHIEDSLLAFEGYKLEGSYIDIGSGGGIPGLVLAIAFPETRWVLVDSIAKKVREIERFSSTLSLSNVTAVTSRIEEYPKGIDRFDGAVMRAVARSDAALELAAPLVENGGLIHLYKGPGWKDEECYAFVASAKLGLQLQDERNYRLSDGSSRKLVTFKKVSETPKGFPRRPGMASKFPLGEK
ncbi:MAG: 16S rRNA (guanine(527)-N(7))-methyltransferase RsmG [Mesotoga sp.]|nr:16S rRNA (guanine(527)-N(7))-methyltransferase RsmG [Mesotoga sp.]HOY26218.1 16S rRNA (guanine(527)-N(7))-methyltransferase RsmG [Mesotoga sp.]HPB63257.1 16S rRNA (guanine(527)-N(7))-methyltransferase RsmG [Mesotoga sp.]